MQRPETIITPFNPFESLAFLTIRVGKLLINKFKEDMEMAKYELQPHHMGILVDLWTRDGVRQQDLASTSIRDKANIARALNALEQQNILVRTPDPKDKRIKRIFLTHKGRELKEKLLPMAYSAMENAVEDIDREEIEVCKNVLKKMYQNLNT